MTGHEFRNKGETQMTTTTETTKCYWITFENEAGERWDEGVPYVAEDEEAAERQMILAGCGGEDGSIEELRERYVRYFTSDGREAADYEINEVED